MPHKKISVLLADDHQIVRFGLSAFIQHTETLELAGEAQDGRHAIKLCQEVRPDVVIMDIVMPELDGIAATHHIKREFPDIKIIALSTFKESEQVGQMLQAGASAYLVKGCSMQQLESTILVTMEGAVTFDQEIGNTLLEHLRKSSVHNIYPVRSDIGLTKREHEILEEMVQGKNNKEIADSLVISRNTVKNHVSSILNKLGVRTRTEAVSFSHQNNLL